MRKYVLLFFVLHILAGTCASAECFLSPFLNKKQGELDSVIETESEVILVELDYARLNANDAKPHIARIYDKGSKKWSSLPALSSIMADGGSREIKWSSGSVETEVKLPTYRQRDEEGTTPTMLVGGRPRNIFRYGASFSGFADVAELVLPLYSADEQSYIREHHHPRMIESPQQGPLGNIWQNTLRRMGTAVTPKGVPACIKVISPSSTE